MSKGVSVFEMVLWATARADALDAWERVHHSEGNDMPEYMQRERAIARQTAKTLMIVMEFEQPFRQIVASRNEARRRANRILRDDAEEQKIEAAAALEGVADGS